MNHGSLFAGIGGFELAAQWMGWNNVFSVEIDPFCTTILQHHFPNSHKHGDITTFDGTEFQGKVDIITGGFPCQPFSKAGNQKGRGDERYLWPEMFRVIREVGPRWVVAENVRAFINDRGLAFDAVMSDLESEGFEVFPCVLGAASVNAPHKRERVFLVAHVADGDGADLKRWNTHRTDEGMATEANRTQPPHRPTQWETFPRFRPVCGGDDGISAELDSMSFHQWRTKSVTAYGNAVCPPLVFELFKAIQKSME